MLLSLACSSIRGRGGWTEYAVLDAKDAIPLSVEMLPAGLSIKQYGRLGIGRVHGVLRV
jgi:hypothetical protein